MQRKVTSRVVLNVSEPADLVFTIAVSGHYSPTHEKLTATVNGAPVTTIELADVHHTRLHRLCSGVGELVVEYEATIDGNGESNGNGNDKVQWQF